MRIWPNKRVACKNLHDFFILEENDKEAENDNEKNHHRVYRDDESYFSNYKARNRLIVNKKGYREFPSKKSVDSFKYNYNWP